MAGIVFILHKDKDVHQETKNLLLNAIANGCYKSDISEIERHSIDNQFSLNLVRNRKSEPIGVYKLDNWVLAYWGYVKFNYSWLDSTILQKIEYALENNDFHDILKTFTGSFQLLLYSRREKKVYCINDKCSTHPWYLLKTGNFFIGVPEAFCYRSVKRHVSWDGIIDNSAIMEFMASGHLWGERSFFKDVIRLGSGKYASSEENEWQLNHHFRMEFGNNTLNNNNEQRLSDAIITDIKGLPKGKAIITLSGGWDSRALVGYAKMMELDFDCISYTFGTNVLHNSDASLAKDIAEKLNVNWRTFVTDGTSLVNNINEVIQATSGESDASCAQDAFLGKKFYYDELSSYDYLLRADEVWGWGDFTNSIDSAFFQCFLFNLDEISYPKLLLKKRIYNEFVNKLADNRLQISSQSKYAKSKRYNDFKDELYWFHRETRLLQNMAAYRRNFIPHIAPFLLDKTIEAIQKTPAIQRIRKRFFISTIKKIFPQLYSLNDNVNRNRMGFSLEQAIKHNLDLQELIKDVLVHNPAPEITKCFNMDVLSNWVSSIIGINAGQLSKGRSFYNLLRYANNAMQKFPKLRELIRQNAIRKGIIKFPVVNANYLFRLTILGISLREYNKST